MDKSNTHLKDTPYQFWRVGLVVVMVWQWLIDSSFRRHISRRITSASEKTLRIVLANVKKLWLNFTSLAKYYYFTSKTITVMWPLSMLSRFANYSIQCVAMLIQHSRLMIAFLHSRLKLREQSISSLNLCQCFDLMLQLSPQ